MEYTKGKWYPTILDGECRIIADTEDTEEVICYGVRHYNMYLIAAAPDMYEALKELVIHGCTSTKAEKALAKAEGKDNG